MIRSLPAFVLCLSAIAATGTNVDLGDLNIPADRVPQWYPPTEAETGYADAQSWPEYDVTCDSEPCASGKAPVPASWGCPVFADSNWNAAINCMLNAAPPRIVLYFPAGTYDIDYAAVVSRSDIVLRGAGRTATILNVKTTRRGFAGGQCDANSGACAISSCNPNYDGQSRAWTAGYGRGETIITLAGTAGFTKGGWARLRMSGLTACEYVDKLLNAGGEPDGFVHTDKVVAVGTADGLGSNQIQIERGLRMDYAGSGCTGHEAFPWDPLVNVGIENMRITSDPSIPRGSGGIYFVGIQFQGVANSWLVDCRIDRFYDVWMSIFYSARLWIQGNDFLDLDESIVFDTEGVLAKWGATDIVIENNYCTDTRVSQENMGCKGVVTAFNYWRQPTAERAWFNHGQYSGENLFEGNDVDGPVLMGDCWWGRNGPRMTVYRNRNVHTGNGRGSIQTNRDGCSGSYPSVLWPPADHVNVIGNTASMYFLSPPLSNPSDCAVRPMDWAVDSMWLEKNIARNTDERARCLDGFVLTPADGVGKNPTTSCGTAPGDSCPGLNVKAQANPPEWDSDIVPHSLYRTTPPSWWCEEACSWDDVHAGIGAWGDDFDSDLCKLPAQIRVEGGPCTPVVAATKPSPPSERAPRCTVEYRAGRLVLRGISGVVSIYTVLGRSVAGFAVRKGAVLDVSSLAPGPYVAAARGTRLTFVKCSP